MVSMDIPAVVEQDLMVGTVRTTSMNVHLAHARMVPNVSMVQTALSVYVV